MWKPGTILLATMLALTPDLVASESSKASQQPPGPQPAPTAQVLTLKDAEALALKNHPQVQSAQYQALASNQVVREELSAYYPTTYGSVTGSAADRGTRIGAGFLTD